MFLFHSLNSIFILKYKNVLRSRHFRSAFLFISIGLTIVCVLICSLICRQRLMDLQKSLKENADRSAASVQNIIDNIQSTSVFIGSMPSVDLILNSSEPTLDHLSQMMKDVSSFSNLYEYSNIVLLFEGSRRIYDVNSGIYHYEDYYNSSLFETLSSLQDTSLWFFHSALPRHYDARREITLLTYVRRLPIYETRGRGSIAVSISPNELQKSCADSVSPSLPYVSVIYIRDQILWSSSDEVSADWDQSKSAMENIASLLPGTTAYPSSKSSDIRCVYYLSFAQQLQAVQPMLSTLFFTHLVSLGISFATSVLYTIHMLRPVDALMEKIGILPYTRTSDTSPDEYFLLNAQLDNMSLQHRKVRHIMQENEQLLREQLLRGILYGQANPLHLSAEYEKSGIQFPFSRFCIILISLSGLEKIRSYPEQEQIKLLVSNNAVNAFSILGRCYSLYTGSRTITIILNTDRSDGLQTELRKICDILKTDLKTTFSLNPLFSIVSCSPPQFYRSWKLAEQNLLFSSDKPEKFFFFVSQTDHTPSVAPVLPELLIRCIVNQDSASMKKLADRFRKEYLTETVSPPEAKRLVSITLYTIFSGLLELDIDIKESILNDFLKKADRTQSVHDYGNLFRSCLTALINNDSKMPSETQMYVKNAIQYLEEHYMESLSIPQIAAHVGVSAIYLNRIFKQETGKTLSEYLNYYRTSRSLSMLTDSSDTINRISGSIGYNDVRSYIRFFKKFYGMTPSEYRKKELNIDR